MIDLHSHILPNLDDGSKDADESIALLKLLSNQGIETVVATPHFYANDESVENFLKRRTTSYGILSQRIYDGLPRIILGAEVRYYQGISRMPDIKKLCIDGTNLLLLEMPFSKWSEYTIKEIIELSSSRNLTVVLAHIERYLRLQNNDVFYRLLTNDILMQANASFFINFFTRRKAMALLNDSFIHFIGSDCHNVNERPPLIGRAASIIKSKFGEEILLNMTELENSIFSI